MLDNADPKELTAFEKAARAAAGLPDLSATADDKPAEDQNPDKVWEAVRKAAGLPGKTKDRGRLQE